ncbi:MAG: hypothetical protein SGJ20_07515 [Planctomycetota bacterium]|nr:hypothetical protein [Planctomycetota bacterium]
MLIHIDNSCMSRNNHGLGFVFLVGVLALFTIAASQAEPPAAKDTAKTTPDKKEALAAKPTQAELEAAFSKKMTGAVLEGNFTTRGQEAGALPKPEKYTLGKVAKAKDDYWTFETRIQYGTYDVTLPLTLKILWAGDTPVITLDDFTVPGFGKFTCRVMFFKNEYAGTWDGGDHGGHLFGKIIPTGEGAPKSEPAKKVEVKE